MEKICPDCGARNSPEAFNCNICYSDLMNILPTNPSDDTNGLRSTASTDETGSHKEERPVSSEEGDDFMGADEELYCDTQSHEGLYSFTQTEEESADETGSINSDYVIIFPSTATLKINQGVLLGRGSDRIQHLIVKELEKYTAVSRIHSWIGKIGQGIGVLDLGSLNGTSVCESSRIIRLTPHVVHMVPENDSETMLLLGKSVKLIIKQNGGKKT